MSQFLKTNKFTTLSDISKAVGSRNVSEVLNLNNLSRSPNAGVDMQKREQLISGGANISTQSKINILNSHTADSDVFEHIALLDNEDWKVMAAIGSPPGYLRIPENIRLPNTVNTMGSASGEGVHVEQRIYEGVMQSLRETGEVDPSVFGSYSSIKFSDIPDTTMSSVPPYQWFPIPWGEVTLYSSLSGDSVDFPVYPNGLEDGVSANYDTMPNMIYQYEPWLVYSSSGPRTNTYNFRLHRDMWTGNHNDGKCNELIRFCEACCYPEFQGAAVRTSTVTLYIAGKEHITGVITSVKTQWDGESPIGQDGFFLVCDLSITITEVAKEPLNYGRVKSKGLIGY